MRISIPRHLTLLLAYVFTAGPSSKFSWLCNPFTDREGNIECVDDDKKFCFVNQGCPNSRIPDSPDEVNTSFSLFTATPDNPFPANGRTFFQSSDFDEAIPDFNASLPLIFIIHGWG